MVISRIIGGLGNQMFQYAAGRALSLKRNTALALDITEFQGYALHQGFELSRVFSPSLQIASHGDVRKVLGWQGVPIVRTLLARKLFASLRAKQLILEPHFQYWPGFDGLNASCYLSGYWQSEKYFSDSIPQIRKDFTFRGLLNGQNLEHAAKIQTHNSVSLHVRRGDYVSNPKNSATYHACSIEYYSRAVRYIAERVGKPTIFIFSDDIKWVEQNLKLDFPCEYITNNSGSDSYNDMRLMSMCRHHVIANSSFSWWGAWLNPSAEKIVIAPRQWFSGRTDVRDLFPTNWVTL